METVKDFDPTTLYVPHETQKTFYKMGKKYGDDDPFCLGKTIAKSMEEYNLILPYLEKDATGHRLHLGRYTVSPIGRVYLDYLHEERKQHNSSMRKWIITTIIALAAVFISLFHFMWDIYQSNETNQTKAPSFQSETTETPM